ncbi:hypothetical protein G2W53_008963 [Senna tora]|uniref:Uncharacterized protein n=1 Tax=Senna tora TaxID=362788 RepID=A0A835C7A5_9FABA|nr:hypothetical protein G2W53_008963 [Senna tora]
MMPCCDLGVGSRQAREEGDVKWTEQEKHGSNGNKAGDHALNGADDGGLVEEDDVEGGPHKEAGGGADVGVEHRHG